MALNTGSGSARLSLGATGKEHYGAGRLALTAQGSGYQAITGDGSAKISLSAISGIKGGSGYGAIGLGGHGEGGVGVGGYGSGRLRIVARSDGGDVGVGGTGAALLRLSSARDLRPGPLGASSPNVPSGYIPISGDGAAGLLLSARGVAVLAEAFEAFLLNTKSRGHGNYENFPFNSLFVLDGICYGCSANGIHRLDGDNDNGESIEARIDTGVLSFNAIEQKQVSDAYVQMRALGDMALDVTCVETQRRSGYVIQYDGEDGLHGRRRKFAKGVKGTSWQFTFRNVAGADFDLRQIDLDIDILKRSS
jgi:hypothetical protein